MRFVGNTIGNTSVIITSDSANIQHNMLVVFYVLTTSFYFVIFTGFARLPSHPTDILSNDNCVKDKSAVLCATMCTMICTHVTRTFVTQQQTPSSIKN